MPANLNTSTTHQDAFGINLHVGDRVLYRTRINDWMSVGIIASFTPTCARVIPVEWEKSRPASAIKQVKDFPTYNAPKHLTVSAEGLFSDPKLTSKWDKLHMPAEFIKSLTI